MSKKEIAKRYTLFIVSLLFFYFTIVGTREGTIISALFTGVVVKFFSKRLKKPLDKVLSDK